MNRRDFFGLGISANAMALLFSGPRVFGMNHNHMMSDHVMAVHGMHGMHTNMGRMIFEQ